MKFSKGFLTALIIISPFFLNAQNIIAEHHFEGDEISQLTINGSFCDVAVTHGDRVIFDGVIKGNGKKGDYTIASIRSGSTIVFNVERSSSKDFNWNSMETARINLIVPYNVSLSIDNSSGDVDIKDYRSSLLDVKASSGDISLVDLETNLTAQTTSGDFELRRCKGDIQMGSTSGDQKFINISGQISTKATSGDIELYGIKGDIIAQTTSGDIKMDEVVGFLNLKTTSGNIEGDEVEVKADNYFKTTSGNIEIELNNELSSIRFQLRTNSGNLEVGSRRGENELNWGSGPVTIKGVSTSGNQSFEN